MLCVLARSTWHILYLCFEWSAGGHVCTCCRVAAPLYVNAARFITLGWEQAWASNDWRLGGGQALGRCGCVWSRGHTRHIGGSQLVQHRVWGVECGKGLEDGWVLLLSSSPGRTQWGFGHCTAKPPAGRMPNHSFHLTTFPFSSSPPWQTHSALDFALRPPVRSSAPSTKPLYHISRFSGASGPQGAACEPCCPSSKARAKQAATLLYLRVPNSLWS